MINSEDIKHNYNQILKRVKLAAEKAGRDPQDILVAPVSKTNPTEVLEAAMQAGINLFAENYAQEMAAKHAHLSVKGMKPSWHFIGHLQTNKVKYLASFVDMIQTVDSVKLAEEISKQAARHNRQIDVLIQVNTSGEDTKSGIEPQEAAELAEEIIQIPNIRLKGLMTIAGLYDSVKEVREEFKLLRNLLNEINSNYGLNLNELSMGMTGDFEAAIEEGATIVRIGSAIFGARNYA